MDDASTAATGWRPIPRALKVLSVVMLLWMAGSVMNLPNLFANGAPLLGYFVDGYAAAAMVVVLDIIGPLVFLAGLWKRKHWAPKWAYAYMGVFIVNGVIALLTVRDELGLPQILVPTVVCLAFLLVVHWKRGYFGEG